MLVTLFGIVILVSPVHPKNASSPMLVTLFGIVIFVSPVHPMNAELAIPTVLALKATDVTEVSQFTTHLSTYDTPFSFCIRFMQLENAEEPMLSTLFPIVTLVSPVPY